MVWFTLSCVQQEANADVEDTNGDSSLADTQDSAEELNPEDVCFIEEPMLFVSVEEHECGLGPEGVNYCHWALEFDRAQFSWQYSDVYEEGAYSCEGNSVIGHPDGQLSFLGEYDPAGAILVWDSVNYTEQN